MSIFTRMKDPVFLKENSDAEKQLEKLKELEPLLTKDGQTLIRQDIKNLEYGIAGERNIIFELKNSHMPLYVLHDIYLECGELTAQIDFLVFTKKLCFIIECKNLYGNIEITNRGDFIRTIEFGGKRKKEGIYSPITQNERHIELMKKIKMENKKNMITKMMVDKNFGNFHKAIVVLANPKTVLNAKYAKKEVKDKVIRADQLVKYIKDANEKSNERSTSEEKALAWAQSYLDLHKQTEKDYISKYDHFRIDARISASITEGKQVSGVTENSSQVADIPVEETELFRELKKYRLRKSREENYKPYFIYNDNQLKDLISKMPDSKEELKHVSGFGEIKADKYGDDIINIIRKYKQDH